MSWIPLPIGVENFEDLRIKDYYYVDKTLFIKELLGMKDDVNLFIRFRSFGKTLNMSMLRYFSLDIDDAGSMALYCLEDKLANEDEGSTDEEDQDFQYIPLYDLRGGLCRLPLL